MEFPVYQTHTFPKATYYLSEIDRSSFYYKRHTLGETEADDSILKINTLKAYKNKSLLGATSMKPQFLYENGLLFKSIDETLDFDFIHKYFDKEAINPSHYKTKKELIKKR